MSFIIGGVKVDSRSLGAVAAWLATGAIESASPLVKELTNFAAEGGVLVEGALERHFIAACDGKRGFRPLRLNAAVLRLVANLTTVEALIVSFVCCAYERNTIVTVSMVTSAAIAIVD